MPLEERFEPRPAETETRSPPAAKADPVDDPPGPAPYQDHIDEVAEQEIGPDETGDMPSVSLDPGDDIGPSEERGTLPGERSPGQ